MTDDGGMPTDDRDVMWHQREAELSWREMDEEVVILDLRSATYLRLNPTGAVLWNRLEPGATVDDLTADLAERFGLRVDQAHEDVVAFVKSCAESGIIERRSPRDPSAA